MSRAADAEAIPRLGFAWVNRSDVAKTRPALERAGYRCEHCRTGEELRVVEGLGHVVVLCTRCAIGDGFKRALAYRDSA